MNDQIKMNDTEKSKSQTQITKSQIVL